MADLEAHSGEVPEEGVGAVGAVVTEAEGVIEAEGATEACLEAGEVRVAVEAAGASQEGVMVTLGAHASTLGDWRTAKRKLQALF